MKTPSSLREAYLGGLLPDSRRDRRSNMELLRIVAMTMILSGHLMYHGLEHVFRWTPLHYACHSFLIAGVDLFFLISGWFGIRFSVKGFVRLVMTAFFFMALSLAAASVAGPGYSGADIAWKLFFPISRSHHWFIMSYMALLVTVPLLNKAVDSMSVMALGKVVALLSLYNLTSCWIGNSYVSYNGYSFMQALWMYCLARWMRRIDACFDSVNRNWYLLGFILISALMSVTTYHRYVLDMFDYNSLPVVLAAVSLFLYFTRLDFKSRVVNYVAPAALGCYLMQDGEFGILVYQWFESTYLSISREYYGFAKTAIVAVLFLGTVAAYWVASLLLTPLSNHFAGWCGGLASRLYGRFIRAMRASAKSRIASVPLAKSDGSQCTSHPSVGSIPSSVGLPSGPAMGDAEKRTDHPFGSS